MLALVSVMNQNADHQLVSVIDLYRLFPTLLSYELLKGLKVRLHICPYLHFSAFLEISMHRGASLHAAPIFRLDQPSAPVLGASC